MIPATQSLEQLAELLANARCSAPRTDEEWTEECVCSIGPTMFVECAKEGLVIRRERWPYGYLLTERGKEAVATRTQGGSQ